MKTDRIAFYVFLIVFVWATGCATWRPDPLAGWKVLLGQNGENLDKAIKPDYQDYIQKVHPKEDVGSIFLLEDGTGQHAVSIEIFIKGENASWQYALIYDKDDKRIKVIKYGYRRYES